MKKLLTSSVLILMLAFTCQATMVHLGDTTGQPSNPQSELSRLEILISGNSSLPTITQDWLVTQTPVENGDSSVSFNFAGQELYLLLKWGNKDCFWYINDLNRMGSAYSTDRPNYYTFYSDNFIHSDDLQPNILGQSPSAGLSHYTMFSVPVPEPTSLMAGALLLLPMGLSLVRVVRRK